MKRSDRMLLKLLLIGLISLILLIPQQRKWSRCGVHRNG